MSLRPVFTDCVVHGEIGKIIRIYHEFEEWIYKSVTGVIVWHAEIFAYAKTKAQISCAIIAKLISAFVFTT